MSVLLFRALLWVSAGHPRSDFGLDSRSRRPECQSCPVKCPVMGFPSAARGGVNARRAATSVKETLSLRYKRSTAFNSLLWGPTAVTNSSGSCSRRRGIVYSARQMPASLLNGSFICPTLHFIRLYLYLHFISSSFFFFFFSLIKTFRNVSQIRCWGSSLSTWTISVHKIFNKLVQFTVHNATFITKFLFPKMN